MGGGVARIRLVATDVDGTLLDPQGCVTPRTHAAIQALSACGVTLALATGRRWTGASQVAATVGFQGPMIVFDGAMTRSYPNGEILSAATLNRAAAQHAAEAMASYGIQPIVQFSDHMEEYLHVAEDAVHPEWTAAYLPMFQEQIRFRPVAALCDAGIDPVRLVAFAPLTILRRVAVDLASPAWGRQLLHTGNYGTAELTLFASPVSKGNALAHLARRLNIPIEETMAIGDGLNDTSMLRAAGLGVAMGHAPRRVRASARVVTGSNGEEGWARAIETYALGSSSGIQTTEGLHVARNGGSV